MGPEIPFLATEPSSLRFSKELKSRAREAEVSKRGSMINVRRFRGPSAIPLEIDHLQKPSMAVAAIFARPLQWLLSVTMD